MRNRVLVVVLAAMLAFLAPALAFATGTDHRSDQHSDHHRSEYHHRVDRHHRVDHRRADYRRRERRRIERRRALDRRRALEHRRRLIEHRRLERRRAEERRIERRRALERRRAREHHRVLHHSARRDRYRHIFADRLRPLPRPVRYHLVVASQSPLVGPVRPLPSRATLSRQDKVVPLPQPLSARAVALYTRIYRDQSEGRWNAADRLLAKLDDPLLRGEVLARRYLAPDYQPTAGELRQWMARYANLPQAGDIAQLARSDGMGWIGDPRSPDLYRYHRRGVFGAVDGTDWEGTIFPRIRRSPRARVIEARLRWMLRRDETSRAEGMLADVRRLDVSRRAVAEMKLALARTLFFAGHNGEAARYASEAASSDDAAFAGYWIAGLSEWRMNDPDAARRYFEALAQSHRASGWMIAAGAFWAARANLVSHHPVVVDHWLEIAATYSRTFYGLLARRVLGYGTLLSGQTLPFTRHDADLLVRLPAGQRALALVQLGEHRAAENELRTAYDQAGRPLREAILAMAKATDMTDLAVQLAGASFGGVNSSTAYPVPPWKPDGGWKLDRALVFAFARQESGFNPRARSPVGAGGLMQLMPQTAVELGGWRARHRLEEPNYNLELGQRYLQNLLNQPPVNRNLIFLAAAYNAGPGKLAQWLAGDRHIDDPLLFIETLPNRETRTFIERVMTNYWIYRHRFGQSSHSLSQVAAGAWPIYRGPGLARDDLSYR